MTIRTLMISSALTLAACSAQAETRTYDLSGFDAVKVSAGVTADIDVGEGFSVEAEGSPDSLDKLDIRVRGDVLSIGRKSRMGFSWGFNDRVAVSIKMPALVGLDASSGSRAEARGVDAQDFRIEASSGASAEAEGRCGKIAVNVSSGASINAGRLECEEATAEGSSGGSARLHASRAVRANASSGASIRVSGKPEHTNINNSSGGSVSVE